MNMSDGNMCASEIMHMFSIIITKKSTCPHFITTAVTRPEARLHLYFYNGSIARSVLSYSMYTQKAADSGNVRYQQLHFLVSLTSSFPKLVNYLWPNIMQGMGDSSCVKNVYYGN